MNSKKNQSKGKNCSTSSPEMEGGDVPELLQRIVDLLVAGGYFRARISSLSPFDKLTGGLAWCITASNVDVDFDLFYDDDATLGYKIKVGEAIEGALQKMECPYPLQAHQIQGLDYKAVYPVVQWLVKRVLMTREMLGDQLRRYSHWRFHKNYKFPEDKASELRDEKNSVTHTGLLDQRPQRLYRRDRKVAAPEEISDRLRSTLLEYGHWFVRPVAPIETAEGSGSSQILSQGPSPSEISFFPATHGPLPADGFLSSSKIGHIVGLCSEEVRVAASQYSHLSDAQMAHQKQAVTLLKQIAGEEKNNRILQEQRSDATAKMSKVKENSKEQEEQKFELLSEMDKLNESVEKAGVGELLQKLLPLVEQHKMSQEEELFFQTTYKKKHAELLVHIQNLENEAEHVKGDDNYKADVESTLQRDLSKLKLLKGDMAKTNQKVLLCRRKLDELPSQTELMQYERCFVELYLHIQGKLGETRKYYATYNALAEANELTVKEISLLNSINVQFEEVMMSQEGRTKFVASMSDVAKGVHQKLEKMEARFLGEQNTLSALRERHDRLVGERRHYVNLMKLFQEECAKNEALRSAPQSSM